eukprot:SAG31_NODE_757_length_12296_cov_8.840289_3_plen_94_part_00
MPPNTLCDPVANAVKQQIVLVHRDPILATSGHCFFRDVGESMQGQQLGRNCRLSSCWLPVLVLPNQYGIPLRHHFVRLGRMPLRSCIGRIADS